MTRYSRDLCSRPAFGAAAKIPPDQRLARCINLQQATPRGEA